MGAFSVTGKAVTLPQATQILLSPDGKRVVLAGTQERPEGGGSGHVCVQQIGGSLRCSQNAPTSILGGWSADGKSVVLTDDWARQAREPDIWLLDVDSMHVRDVTDDGESDLLGAKHPHIDIFPAFADGKVRFLRSNPDGDTMLCSMPASGGDAHCEGTVHTQLSSLASVSWSPDGSRAALLENASEGGASTLRVVDGSGHEQWKATADGGKAWSRVDFSPDGRYVLVQPQMQAFSNDPRSGCEVFSADRGTKSDVDSTGAAYSAAWVPGSDAIVHTGTLPGNPSARTGLWVVANPGGKGRRFYTQDANEVVSRGLTQPGLQWDGHTLVASKNGTPIALTVKD